MSDSENLRRVPEAVSDDEIKTSLRGYELLISALHEEVSSLANETNPEVLLKKCQLFAELSHFLRKENGYHREVVCAVSDRLLEMTAFSYIDYGGNNFRELRRVLKIAKEASEVPRHWMLRLLDEDPSLRDKKNIIRSLSDELSPNALLWQMSGQNYDRFVIPTYKPLPELLRKVDVVSLGKWTHSNDFGLLCLLPVLMEYLEKGGNISYFINRDETRADKALHERLTSERRHWFREDRPIRAIDLYPNVGKHEEDWKVMMRALLGAK